MTSAGADAPGGRPAGANLAGATRAVSAPGFVRSLRTESSEAPVVADHLGRGAWQRRAAPGRRALTSARAVLFALRLMILAVLFGQRLALPVGSTPLPVVLVAVYAVLVILVAAGALRHDRVRFELFEVGMAACCAATVLAAFRAEPFSVASLLYLLLSYLPWIFCVRATFAWTYPLVVRFFLDAMALVAVLAVAQMAAQLVGLGYPDPLSSLPAGLVVDNFNTTYPIVYGSPILKSNGMVMLEPSFLSQYLALAGVAAVMTRAPLWRLALYGAALAASVSGTGLVLAFGGLVVLLVRAPGRLRPGLVWPALGLVAVLLATPVGTVLAERRNELSEGGSSATLRFLTPYSEVAEGLEADPDRYLTGAGAGASDRVLESGRGRAGLAVVYPSLPKLVFEYGLVAGLLFGAFMALCLFWRTRLPVIPTCCFLLLFVLSGSLLQPHTVFLVWMLTSLFGRSDAEAAAFGAARRVSLADTVAPARA